MNNEREREIRYSIRSIIKHVKKKRLNEETQLRAIIRGFIDHEMKNLNESQVADTNYTGFRGRL